MGYHGMEDGGTTGTELSLDDVLELLSNYQRRAIIDHLRSNPGQVHSVDDVIAHLRGVEQQRTANAPEEDNLLSLLVHIHCPKLQDAGLVEYDMTTSEIRYYPNEVVERILEGIDAATTDDVDRE